MAIKLKQDHPIKKTVHIIFKRLWIIVLCTAIFTTGAFIVSKYIIEKEYTASVSMYVTPQFKNMDAGDYLNYISYSKQVVDTYTHILKTNSFLRALSESSNLGYSVEKLDKMIKVEVVDETEIFSITVTTKSPRDSFELAKTAAMLAPDKILEIKTADKVNIVDEAVMPKRPSSPNVFLNTLIGFILGLGLGYLIVNVIEIFDSRIKDEDDFLNNYEIPIIGIIPKIKEE